MTENLTKQERKFIARSSATNHLIEMVDGVITELKLPHFPHQRILGDLLSMLDHKVHAEAGIEGRVESHVLPGFAVDVKQVFDPPE